VRQRLGQLRFLVETGDLDDELHGPQAEPYRVNRAAPRACRRINAPWSTLFITR